MYQVYNSTYINKKQPGNLQIYTIQNGMSIVIVALNIIFEMHWYTKSHVLFTDQIQINKPCVFLLKSNSFYYIMEMLTDSICCLVPRNSLRPWNMLFKITVMQVHSLMIGDIIKVIFAWSFIVILIRKFRLYTVILQFSEPQCDP